MKSHTAWERLYLAVGSLASGESGIINRLENVYSSHIIPLNENEFKSEKSKQLFESIRRPIIDGRLHKGVLINMTSEEASQIAKEIVSLLIQIDHFNDED
ncbi:hypothetical protein BSK59_13395 [Paenibacillus odorifer]|uniref:hypothetical protein n=1 Tax=Paenibacillus odorifer TaxID=189426 RepID=UPI00096F151F|nr:hypothetical protein [Paenibacillus odorifer]OME55467.1 hypothetical protein BSK59_13395 [Paenibacillus odorifer]